MEIARCKHKFQAYRKCTWAKKVTKVNDGWLCFESQEEFDNWKKESHG